MKCLTCKTPLAQPGGFYGTDLCGPCCTGEADTHGHLSYECKRCSNEMGGIGEETPCGYPIPTCWKCSQPMSLTEKKAFK